MVELLWYFVFNIWFVLGVIVTGLIIFYKVVLPNNGLPPGPITFPIIGNCWLFNFPFFWAPIGLRYEFYVMRFGPIVTFYRPTLSIPHLIVLGGYDVIQQGPIQNPEYFADTRPETTLLHKKFKSIKGALQLFTNNKTNIDDKIKTDVKTIKEYFRCSNGGEFDPRDVIYSTAANMMSSLIFGKRFNQNDLEFKELKRLHSNFRKYDNAHLPLNVPELHLVRSYDKALGKYRRWVQDQVSKCKPSPGSVLDLLRDQLCEENDIIDICSALHRMGSETLSATLNWGIVFLTAYTIIQKRVQEELDGILGKDHDRDLQMTDLPSLPYLTATVREILRISSIIKVQTKMVVKDGLKINKYKIPKGSLVVLNLSTSAKDVQHFLARYDLIPERWLPEAKTRYTMDDKYEAVFSYGDCACPMRDLALPMLTLTLGNLLHKFEFQQPVTPTQSAPSEGRGHIVLSPMSYNTVAIMRPNVLEVNNGDN